MTNRIWVAANCPYAVCWCCGMCDWWEQMANAEIDTDYAKVKKEKNMANDNETVEQACESICELVIAIHDKEHNEKQEIKNAWHIVQQVKDRFLAAHKREMADEKRISDAVIQSLRDKKLEMAGEIAEKDEEIARLRALVKELSNIAERFVSCKATYCEIACRDIKEKCIHKKTIELVAKAREAIGGTE